MYTEIVKIIEGGLVNDKEKVANYAKVLADGLEKCGDIALSNKIRNVLQKRRGSMTSLDSFSVRPVDSESRMDIVEVATPQIDINKIVLSRFSMEAINSFVDSYQHRDLLMKSDIDVSNTLLLYGPPGCGKTTVAQYISFVTGLPLVTAKLDALVSSLLGSTAKNIRKIFEYAYSRECILFLDEFDVIAKLRDDKNELGELKRVVNSLIQNIDMLGTNNILIAATNHQKLLDPAVWRRFNTIVSLDKPSKEEIEVLLSILLLNKKNNFMNNNRKMIGVVESLVGLSHSDIKTIVFNALKETVLARKEELTNGVLLKSIYFYKNHMIDNEENFVAFLLKNNITHREINEFFGIPLRKIQNVSKNFEREE